MMSSVMCPTCQHKQLLDESEMGKLQTCPNCRSSFVAGKSSAVGRGMMAASPMLQQQPQQQPQSYSKTMLTEEGPPPIKYNCPRCKSPLEVPASEGSSKRNCPSCSQRHQVPAAPAAPKATAPMPALNKTMLTGDESAAPPAAPPIKFNCPNCKKPLEAPANEGGTKKNCPSCSQRYQVPAAPASGLNKTRLASDDSPAWVSPTAASAPGAAGAPLPMPGAPVQPAAKGDGSALLTPRNVLIALILILLLGFVVPAVINGGKRTDGEAAARAQMELEKLKADIEAKKHEVDRQKAAETSERQKFDDLMKKMAEQNDKMRAEQMALLKSITEGNKKSELEKQLNDAQRKFDEEKREMERKQQQALEEEKRKLEESKRALNTAQTKQQTIIQQAPPVVYYPPYHPRYYWPWGW
jgi:DNA-directed RNA polymerase subunit RPC12/RpoP